MNDERNENGELRSNRNVPEQTEGYIPYYLRNDENTNTVEMNPQRYEEPMNTRAEPQPIYYADARAQGTGGVKKKKRRTKIIAALLVIAVLGGTVGTMSLLYEIQPGDGNTLFTVARRGQESSSDRDDLLSENQDSEAGGENTESNSSEDPANGPALAINPAPASPSAQNLVTETGAELTVAQIAAKVKPSTVGVVSSIMSEYGTGTCTGTGIIMTADGYIITNNHVIDGANSINIMLMDGKTYEAKLIGADARSDIAVVKINVTGLTAAEFGDSDALLVGDLAVAIGNPLGLELMGTVTDGIISAINRDVVIEERTMTLIQTNAAINAGNSGGPLINKYGQVIGINTLKMQDNYTSIEGLGFAIPTNTAKDIIDELIQNGYIKGRPAIGISSGRVISEAEAKYYKLPQGVVVYSINTESDAYKQGLQINDIIVKAQGEEVKTTDDINRIKEENVAGDEFTLTVYRDGKYIDITFKLMDESEMDATRNSGPLLPNR